MNLREEFYKKHLPGFIDRIFFWLLFRRLRRMKLAQLWESYLDLNFLEIEMKSELEYDDSEDRQELLKERQKQTDKQDQAKISDLEDKISKAKAIKLTHRKTKEFIVEVERYLRMLELWDYENYQK